MCIRDRVHVDGLISGSTEASAKNGIEALRKAFKDKNTVGVIVEIDSPGGSPVQAGEIYDEIQKLRQQYPKIPIHAVAGDVCASGGYYIAAAAQKIYANKASIVGSIGVRMDSFGFTDAISKPVSYTHLDVYKRQDPSSRSARRSTSGR